jgi:hypothetical protein
VALASKAVSEAGITMPVLVDEIDNPLWCSYGQMPNNACFIGRDGRIILYQDWNKTAEMETAITAYLALNQATSPAPR